MSTQPKPLKQPSPGPKTRIIRGYRHIYLPKHPAARSNGYAFEHRVVWWDVYGPIPAGKVIHHKNRDKLDNRIENLECLTLSEHVAAHESDMGPVCEIVVKGDAFLKDKEVVPIRIDHGARVFVECCLCGTKVQRRAHRVRMCQKNGHAMYCGQKCAHRAQADRFTAMKAELAEVRGVLAEVVEAAKDLKHLAYCECPTMLEECPDGPRISAALTDAFEKANNLPQWSNPLESVLRDLFGAVKNEMVVRGLPLEWRKDTPMGRADAALARAATKGTK